MKNFPHVQKALTLDPQHDFCIVTKDDFFISFLTKSWFDAYERKVNGITKIVVDLEEKNEKRLKEHLQEGDLFSPLKLLVIRNYQNIDKSNREIIDEILKSPSKKINFLFFSTKRCNFKKGVTISDYNLTKKLNNADLANVIKWIVSNEGGFIEEKAVNMLIDYIGDNLMQLYNEILKLLNYKNGRIDSDGVSNLVVRIREENIFDLTDSLARKDKKNAMKIVNNLISQGSYPLRILAVVITHFRRLLKIKIYMLNNSSISYIMKETGFKEFYVNKLMRQANTLSLDRVKFIIQTLSDIELKIKGNKIPPAIVWDSFILNL